MQKRDNIEGGDHISRIDFSIIRVFQSFCLSNCVDLHQEEAGRIHGGGNQGNPLPPNVKIGVLIYYWETIIFSEKRNCIIKCSKRPFQNDQKLY